MASQGLPHSYAAQYKASSTRPVASFASESVAFCPVVSAAAALTTGHAAAEYGNPEVRVNPPATEGTLAPSSSYMRQLGTQYLLPSSAPSFSAEGPPGTMVWSSDPLTAGASLAVPPPAAPRVTLYQQPSFEGHVSLLAPNSSAALPLNTSLSGAGLVARPRLLPPLSTGGGWLGKGRFSSAAFTAEDMPGFNSLRRGIVFCVMVLLVSSLFACIGRTDFNFVLYLLGYHLWCVESDTKSVTGVKRLIRGARQYAILLCIAAVVDTTWLFIAYSTWVCEKGDPELCFPEPENLKVRWAYGIHGWALGLSTFNLLLKLLVIFLSFAWIQKQRAALGLAGGGPMPGGTSISPPPFD